MDSPVHLASISEKLRIWSQNENHSLHLNCDFAGVPHSEQNSFHCVSWNHTNQVIAVGGTKRKIDLVQVSNGQLLSSLNIQPDSFESAFDDGTNETENDNAYTRCVSFSHNSRYLATAVASTVQVWDLKKRALKSSFYGHSRPVSALTFHLYADSSTNSVIAGDLSGAVRIWDSKTSESSMVISQ